jgi:hypothetical protein
MTLAKLRPRQLTDPTRHLWFEKIMALLALANYLLVLFNLSYIPLRDFWLQGRVQVLIKLGSFEQGFPDPPLKILPFRVTDWYDWVKGIEPYRDTEEYLKQVDALNNQLNLQALQAPGEATLNSSSSSKTIDELLADLRRQSTDIIDKNPFQLANKTGTLERIKNKMRRHIFGTTNASTKEAFTRFWSLDHLRQKGWRQELNFFDSEIKPLLQTNYYRPVGENGEFIDNFGLLDFPFGSIFFIEFLLRTRSISRRYRGLSWFDAMLWRWYDILLFLPFFRWLRILPVIIRLQQSELIDIHAIQQQARRGVVASIAQDITQVVVIQIVNQLQIAIRQGEMGKRLSQHLLRDHVDINNINEVAEIAQLVSQVVVDKILPQIRPDLEALLFHVLDKFLQQFSLYRGITSCPGGETLKFHLIEQITTQIYQILSETLANFLQEDPVFSQLLEDCFSHLKQAVNSEIQAKQSLEKIEFLLSELLEEIKINYIERTSEENIEAILEEARSIYEETQP